MQTRNIINGLLFAVSLLIIACGLWFMGMYVWEGIIVRIGEPDQSLLFWYLPLLFIGIIISLLGITLFGYTFGRNKK